MKIQTISVYNLFFKFFFFIFPFLLISGPFLPDLFISIISFFFIIYCIIYKKILFFKKKLIIFFLIFYLYINLNSFFSFIPMVSFSTTLPYIRIILFSVFTAYLLSNIINLKQIIFYSFFFSFFVLFCDSLIQMISGQNILGYPVINNRISSFFGGKLIMGSYVTKVLPILLAITYYENFKYINLLRFLCISLAGILVFLSAERTASFFYIFTLAVYLILLPNKKQIIINFSLLFLLFAAFAFIKPSSTYKIYQSSLEQIFEKKTNKERGFNIFSYRHEMHFLTAYKMFMDRILIGHGVKSFRYLCDDSRYSTKNKIIDDNKIFAPIDGYVFTILGDPTILYLVPIVKKNEFIENLKKFNIRELNKFDSNAHHILDNFIDNNSIYKFTYYKESLLLLNVQDSTYINKGDYIFSSNEHANGCNTHPHNIHLQILAETGLIGYFFLLSFIIYLIAQFFKVAINIIFKKELKNKRKNLSFLFILLGLIQALFPIIPSGNIFNNWISVVFFFQLAFLFNYLYYNKKINK